MQKIKFYILKLFILLLTIVFISSCGLQEKKKKENKILGFNIIQEDRTINFVLPESCLTSYEEWFKQMNDKGYILNTNIYEVDHYAPFGNIKYLAMINSDYLNNMNLWSEVSNYLNQSCYGVMLEKIDAKNIFYKDQDLLRIYQLEVPITNIRLNNKTIEVYYNKKFLNEHMSKSLIKR